jgi:glycosyltransferase involved in cell wall biosynthesis
VTPSVSAVVPVHDGARFLGEALASIHAQDHPGLELIVVDDGSRDGSAEIARRAGARVIVQEQAGVAAARNAGVAAASGELLAFLDQDDRWAPDKLCRQVALLGRDPDAGLVVGRMRVRLQAGAARPDWLRQAWLEKPVLAHQVGAFLVRRAAWEQVGPFDERYVAADDADWLLRAYDAGAAVALHPEVVLEYRIHEGNASHRRDVVRGELLRAVRDSVHRKRRAQEVS